MLKRINKIEVKPLKSKLTDDEIEIKKLPIFLPKPYTLLLVVAKIGSGKSTALLNLAKYYGKFYDQIIYMAPTDAQLDPKFSSPDAPEINMILTYDSIEEVIRMIKDGIKEDTEYLNAPKEEPKGLKLPGQKKKKGKRYKTHDIRRTLWILDDSTASEVMKRSADLFRSFLTALRHNRTSIWIVAHQWKMISKLFRINATALMIFKINNDEELREIENDTGIDKFIQIYKVATSEPYSFLLVDFLKEDQGRFIKNFSHVII
jgi:hypothetical protein